jgi:hypothetical protein
MFKSKAIKFSSVGHSMGAMITAGTILTGGVSPSIAAVGEGDLPAGSQAFSKLLKYQKDWSAISTSAQKRGSEMDSQEILSIKRFLKALANEYYDMEVRHHIASMNTISLYF